MEVQWLEQNIKYDGTQLAPLYNYLNYGLLGDSMVGWQGACEVLNDHMIDGEDLRQKSTIAGDNMLHFVLELFDFPLPAAVTFQRLMGEILMGEINQFSDIKPDLQRKGDDLYQEDKKLNISIATCSATSSLIHFGLNITNEGTPVKTTSLKDFNVQNPTEFAKSYIQSCQVELQNIKRATKKVITF